MSAVTGPGTAAADPPLLQVGGDDQVRGEGRPRLPTPDTVPEMLCHILQLFLTSACFNKVILKHKRIPSLDQIFMTPCRYLQC